MKWKIGILCAGDTELAPFLPCIQNPVVTENAMLKVYEGTIQGVDVAALYSGVGKVNAAVAAQILIDRYGVNGLVNAGTSGGMAPSVRPFDIVVTTEAAYHDVADDLLTDFHPWLPTVYIPSDSHFLSVAERVAKSYGYPVRFGPTVTGEAFIEEEWQRENILAHYAPLSVDMETAAVAHVCYVNRIPFIAIRSVTDTAEKAGLETFEENCEKASWIAMEMTVRFLAILTEDGR